ncbi:MAG: EAL domain-containing protein [Oscillospiraceae bacterium]|nr:EAL domain-containing protein [Oscillospiraceae bacterium]
MTFNVTAECIAMYISLIIGISVSLSVAKWNSEKRVFVACAFSISLSSFFNILSAVFINNYGIVPRWLNYIVTMLYFAFLFVTLAIYCTYFLNIIEREDSPWKRFYKKAVAIPLYASLAIVFTTPLTKLLFSFDDSGYVRGPLNKITYAVMMYMAFLTVFAALQNGRKTTFRVKILIAFFPVLSGMVMLVQFFASNILLTGTAALGPLILMFLYLGTDIVDIDSVTGFFGSRSFSDAAAKRLQKNGRFCCVMLNVNNSQELKETFGRQKHRRLITLAAVKAESVMPRVPSFRYSENKFIFIFDNKSSEDIEELINDINNEFAKELTFDNTVVYISISMSAVSCPEQADTAERLTELLEYCALQAKKSKTSNICFCDDSALARISRKKEITDILKRELNAEENSFELFYQPIYEVSSGRFRTAEALIRLNKTEIGPIYPDEFIPIAEEMGLIVRLGEIVLDKSCRFISELMKDNIDFEAISVNFSVQQIMRSDIVEKVVDTVRRYDIPPEKLRIEITESVIIDNFSHVKNMMNELGSFGIKFYMDDFGTGYSNLSNMIELPFEYLKIDKSLVYSAEKSEKAYFILMFISQAFIKQNVKILTEGVETEKQERIVDTIGASYIQGFRFARPVNGDTAKEYFLGIRNDAV